MFHGEQKLRHLPFFEVIASHEESDAEWRAATAGLVVLRLVDAWIADGPAAVNADDWAKVSVRGAIDELGSQENLRTILSAIVDALENTAVVDLRVVAPRLLAYAQFLEYEAKWTLSADIYDSIIAHTHPVQEADIATQAHLRLGYCLRQMGNLTASLRAYQTAGSIAKAANDMVGVLRARLGEAKAATARGNLPQAASILDDTIARAVQHQLNDVKSRALHDRADVAHLSGDYELAVGLAYEALEISESPHERDRILGDIAATFYRLGVRSAARDAYLILSATAQEQYGRWTAMLNLMELAADEGDEVLFETYRRSLSPDRMPPVLETGYWLHAGVGLGQFDRLDEAHDSLVRARDTAEVHQLNQMMFQAEAALKALGTRERVRAAQTELPTETVQHIADMIRGRREGAGV